MQRASTQSNQAIPTKPIISYETYHNYYLQTNQAQLSNETLLNQPGPSRAAFGERNILGIPIIDVDDENLQLLSVRAPEPNASGYQAPVSGSK